MSSIPKSAYVYRSIREGNRVRRTYVGSLGDPVVQALLESERLSKATCEAEQRKSEHELKIVETMNTCLSMIHKSSNRAVRNLRKRCRRSNQMKVRRLTMPETNLVQHEYEALVADAADGDMDCLTELRQLLKTTPHLRAALGDLNHHVQLYLIDLASGGALDVKESLKHSIITKRIELLEDGDSLPEVMLVDQILSTMLDAAVCQLGCSQQHAKESIARRWERRLTAAQTRHQSAIQSLIEVRQMLEANSNTGKTE
jgi:hypothetical protein